MPTVSRTSPPLKRAGQGKGPRRIDGAVLDVRCGSLFLGWSEKRTRGMIARRLIPFRKIGGRIVFLRDELQQWLATLDGCSLGEARANQEARR
ncbi:MAG: helix-turn-helix domain-containing protein [Nitrospira sp.]|nr:helix-turn-helix domain-containing protein [Nitrospira sp.]